MLEAQVSTISFEDRLSSDSHSLSSSTKAVLRLTLLLCREKTSRQNSEENDEHLTLFVSPSLMWNGIHGFKALDELSLRFDNWRVMLSKRPERLKEACWH